MTQITVPPRWWHTTGLVLLVSSVVTLGAIILIAFHEPAAIWALLPMPVLPAVALLLMTARVRIVATADDIRLEFVPVYRRRVVLADIAHVVVTDVAWQRFGGVGLRFRGSEVGLLVGRGRAVTVTLHTGRAFVVQCPDPDTLSRWITTRIGEA